MQRLRFARLRSLLGAAFVANIVFVATARSTLVIVAALLLLFGFRQFRWKGVLAVGVLAGVLAGVSWVARPTSAYAWPTSSPKCRTILTAAPDVGRVAARVLAEVGRIRAAAPLVGQGTGTIAALFRRNIAGEPAPRRRSLTTRTTRFSP